MSVRGERWPELRPRRSGHLRQLHPRQDDALQDIYALHELLDDWFLKVWNHRPHGGLRDLMQPERKLTPYEMFTAASQLTSNLETTFTPDDYIAMLPTKYRHVTDTGVTINYRQFDAEELNPLRNTKSDIRRRNGKYEVKLDPYNPVKAWVANPKGGWIECTVRNEDAHFYPHLEDRDFDLTDADTDRSDVAAVTAALAGAPLHTAIETTPDLPSPNSTDPDDDVIYVLD